MPVVLDASKIAQNIDLQTLAKHTHVGEDVLIYGINYKKAITECPVYSQYFPHKRDLHLLSVSHLPQGYVANTYDRSLMDCLKCLKDVD